MSSCLVISPFGKPGGPIRQRADRLYERVITPAVRAGGYTEIIRTIDMPASRPGLIARRVIRLLRDCDLVVADLTAANANVTYELALRHVARLPYVLLCENPDRLPFYLKGLNGIEIVWNDAGLERARQTLEVQIASIKSGDADLETEAWRVFGSKSRARVYRWEVQYAPSLNNEWLLRQPPEVQESVQQYLRNEEVPQERWVKDRLIEYLTYRNSAGQVYTGELYYVTRHRDGHFDGHAFLSLSGSTDREVIKVDGQEQTGMIRIRFFQPPRMVEINPLLVTRMRPFIYVIEFHPSGEGPLKGVFHHPEYLASPSLCIGDSLLHQE